MKQAALESRRLGPGGLTVSALGLGCMGMSDAYGPADRAGSIATIRHALEVGVCLLDTADAYGRGHNEELVGAAIAGLRDRAVLATKFGIEVSRDGSRRINGRPGYVPAAVFTDDLDLARAHSGDLRTAVADGALAWDDARHLGAALDGTEARPSARPDSGAITVFCSHGVGSWDLELARIALERAEAAGAGHRLGLDMGRWRDGM